MPIYEFECGECGKRFDRLQKLSDPDPTECPACTRPAVRRRVTAPSFRLAGSGWYETDFKKDGDKKRNLVDGGSGSDGAGSPAAAASTDSGASTASATAEKAAS
ncbi:MAG: zinc ribbon domain-containing protein [Rhodanobacteraceae bacterium]|nr:zinc ribbon domain-containing protein [Rhodanobacteraceae bacterium]